MLADLIEKAYQDLPSEIKARFDERFANRPLSFEFRSGASRNQIASKMDDILTELVPSLDQYRSGLSSGSAFFDVAQQSKRLRP